MAGPLHKTKQYRENRKKLLEDAPLCALCGVAPATTADFIIPESKGGRPHLSNLRPACLSCNSSRGNRMRTRYSASW